MAETPSPAVLAKLRKLARLPEEVKQSRWEVSVTRLTTLKSLCHEAKLAHRFVTYLARKTLEGIEHGKGRSSHPDTEEQRVHKELMTDALAEMEAWIRSPSDPRRRRLVDLLGRMRQEQNEYKRIAWGPVRIVTDWELLLFEEAVTCLLHPERDAPNWAYQIARDYAERYNPRQGTGLVAESVPLLQDIVAFWLQSCDLDPAALTAPARARKGTKTTSSSTRSGKQTQAGQKKERFTHRQGQFLAFIHLYRRLHREGPAELDLVKYFRVTPPSVHDMIVRLEELGLITREPGVGRSARVSIAEAEIPALEDVPGPPW